jgi:hypothetical protein
VRTEAERLAAIETAKRIEMTAKETAIIRFFAIAMTFYRQPVGDRAFDELHRLIGADTTCAVMFLMGFSVEANSDQWEGLAFP